MQLAKGELPLSGDLSLVIGKGNENRDSLQSALSGAEIGIRLERANYEPPPTLFGTTVRTGPIIIQADRARVRNAEQARRDYDAATDGEGVDLIIEPIDKFRMWLVEATNSHA
jgi:hypothetical protein